MSMVLLFLMGLMPFVQNFVIAPLIYTLFYINTWVVWSSG